MVGGVERIPDTGESLPVRRPELGRFELRGKVCLALEPVVNAREFCFECGRLGFFLLLGCLKFCLLLGLGQRLGCPERGLGPVHLFLGVVDCCLGHVIVSFRFPKCTLWRLCWQLS